MYDLVFLGIAKTGTNSLFEMLTNHPEIGRNSIKDYYIESKKYYISTFDVTDKTKVLLDGSPSTFTSQNEEGIRNIKGVKRKRCIYTIRNPIDRIISTINHRIVMFKKYGECPELFDNGKIILNKTFIVYFIYLSDINNLYQAELLFGRENIFICKLNQVEDTQKDIYDFLEVDNGYNFKLNKLNTNDYHDERIDFFINKNRKLIDKIYKQSLKSIKELYGV